MMVNLKIHLSAGGTAAHTPPKKRAGAARPGYFFVKNELVKAQNDEYIFTEMIKKCKI